MIKTVISTLTFVSTAVLISACATGPSAYGPAGSDSAYGFSNYAIEQDRYRVSFTGQSEAEAHDYALLRAAELTLEQGYTHFKIVDGGVSGDQRSGSPISTSVGIGFGSGRGGYYGRGSRTNVGVGIGIHDLGRALEGNKVTQHFEVRLRRSGDSQDPAVYNAQSVASSIKPAVFQ